MDESKLLEDRRKVRDAIKGPKLLSLLKQQGVEVIEPENTEQLSGTVCNEGFEKLSPTGMKVLNDLVANSKSYLSGTIIRDNFGEDRPARRAFWNEIEKKYGRGAALVRERDKLRGNVITGVRSYFDWLVVELNKDDIHTPQAELVREWEQELGRIIAPEEYVQKTTDEKIEVTKEVDKILRAFLDLVTEK